MSDASNAALTLCVALAGLGYTMSIVVQYDKFLTEHGLPSDGIILPSAINSPITADHYTVYGIKDADSDETLCIADGLRWVARGTMCYIADKPRFRPWPFEKLPQKKQ